MNKLSDQLEEFKEARRNAFVTALRMSCEGKHLAGVFGVNIPREILWALDIVPMNIYSIDDSNIIAAEEILSTENCPLIKASYGYAITGKCPLTYFSDIIIGTDMCHNKFHMIQKLNSQKKIYILPELSDVDSLAMEYIHFVSYLEDVFDLKLSEDKIVCAIKKTNSINKKTQELYAIYFSNPNILSSDDFFSIIYGSQFILNLDERYEKLSEIIESINNINNEKNWTANSKLKRIIISGAPQAGLKEKTLNQISSIKNTSVYAKSFCEGESYEIANEDKDKSPYVSLAEKYLLHKSDDISNADALININLTGCHLTNTYEHLDKPYLSITTDYSDNDSEEIFKKLNSFINEV